MDIARLQSDICKEISQIGGVVKWKKEMGWPAKWMYKLTKKEPVLNIEALLLGERFAVVVAPQKRNNLRMFTASKYRIFVCNSLLDFKEQFRAFMAEKLKEA